MVDDIAENTKDTETPSFLDDEAAVTADTEPAEGDLAETLAGLGDDAVADDPEEAEPQYRIVTVNQQMLISLFNLLARGHADTGGLDPIDENRAIVNLSMQIKNRSVFGLMVPVEQGKSRLVGAFGWGINDIWYAAEGTAQLFDLFWYVLPEHRGRGAVELLDHAIRAAQERFPGTSIRIDNINASVNKDALEKLYEQVGLTKVGSVYRVA